MSVDVSIIISVVALLATFYQAYLQRRHNEKSVKPLAQIDLPDHKKQIAVYVRNNGLGPLIIDRLIFAKDGNIQPRIKDCLDLDPKSYMHVSVSDLVKRIVLPNAHLIVFEKHVESLTQAEVDHIREQLTPITLKVEGRDIYDNKITIERDLDWFSRYSSEDAVEP